MGRFSRWWRRNRKPSLYNDPKEVAKAREKLNEVSPSFCMAKWMHSTFHLQLGRTHSCYLNPTHQIPRESLKNAPENLHNTPQKTYERKLMREGIRPDGCQACWDVEDLEGDHFSERHFRGQDSWIKPFYSKVTEQAYSEPINPTYLEVSFSAQCNFKCSYCAPPYSTSWQKEVLEHGGYQLSSELAHHDPQYLKERGEWPLPAENNPFTHAFWKWWPTLKKDLMFFRITGGEPLLSKDTFKVLKEINSNPLPQLELSLNSNLGIPADTFESFLGELKMLNLNSPTKKKVKKFMLHTSIDAFGREAEYIRNGLNFDHFKQNVERYLTEIPEGGLSFMVTFNALSLTTFTKLLEWLLYLRQKYQTPARQILFDTPHLKHPRFMCLQMLPDSYQERMVDIIEFMKNNLAMENGIKESELIKMKRMLSWMEAPNKNREKEQKDFRLFFQEHDRRRQTNFLEIFPQFKDLYHD